MRKPDARNYNPAPTYLRQLIDKTGMRQHDVAATLGIGERSLRYYLAAPDSKDYRPCPYPVQFAMECLAEV